MGLGKDFSWWTGRNEKLEWLQFGEQNLKIPLITFTRVLADGSVKILIHSVNDDEGFTPGPAMFSMETGTEDQTVAVDGYGMLVEMNDGKIGFQTPQLAGENKDAFSNVVKAIDDSFRIVINRKEFVFPTNEFKAELQNIFR